VYTLGAAHVVQHIARVITGHLSGRAVEQVRSGVAPSGEAGEVDLAVRCAPDQWEAVQTCLAGLGCRWQTHDPEGRLVQYGMLRHEGHDFFVHVYLIEAWS
jgi:hypothetical protein